MYIGEKLTALSQLVYEHAKVCFSNAKLDPALAEFVVRDVHRRFSEEAYIASIMGQLEESGKTNKEEPHEEVAGNTK